MSKKYLILEKSIELFAENGFEATSVQQITERCGISKGAFYLYFKSKDELISSLVDYFMSSIITDIEQSVSNEEETDKLLYNYLFVSFNKFQEHANFTKIFLKEQAFSFNKDLFDRLRMYMSMLNKILLTIIKKQYSKTNPNMHLDLIFSINGLMNSYSELFFIDDYPIDLHHLCKSIDEKITLIAQHSTLSSITPEYLKKANMKLTISREEVMDLLEEASQGTNGDPILEESLALLKEDLVNPKLNDAIIQGLLNNIREKRQGRWVAYMYQQYISQEN